MKKCTDCGDWKELSEFHKDKQAADGHSFACKLCRCARSRTYYKGEAERISERTKEYYKTHPEKKADRNEKKAKKQEE